MDTSTEVKHLSAADQQLLEIAKALDPDTRLLVLDEPTAALSTREVDRLMKIITRLKADGVAILFVGHRLNEVFALADRVTVSRDGSTVVTGPAKEFTPESAVGHMVGRSVETVFPKADVELGPVGLEVRGLGRRRAYADVVTNGWIDVMKAQLGKAKYSGMRLVKTSYGDDDAKKSYDAAVALLRAYPNLRGIMAPTPIAMEAGVKATTDLGVADRVVVTGLGNPGSDAELLKTGQVPAYVLWSPRDLGYLTYYAAAAYTAGEITGRAGETFAAGRLGRKTIGPGGEIVMGHPITFTKDNVDRYLHDFETTG